MTSDRHTPVAGSKIANGLSKFGGVWRHYFRKCKPTAAKFGKRKQCGKKTLAEKF